MEVVGDFEFGSLGVLGSGAFAAVFKGRHIVNTDYIVAVKKIKKSVLPDLTSKEIKILKELTQLQHENVVNLLDCKDGADYVCLVMEYCNGGTLADYMQARGVLGETTIAVFFSQIAKAMRALHSKGIVHRDLKPHNILLCHSGSSHPQLMDITVKIADFGFARFLNGGVMAGTICGSPLYMAPEILVSGRYDAKADLWSLAVIIYQCLVGRPPFPAASVIQLQKLYENNPDMQPALPSSTSPELCHLLINLLKISPRKRMEFAGIDRSKSNASLESVSSDINILSSSPLRFVPGVDKTTDQERRQHRQKHSHSNNTDNHRHVNAKQRPGNSNAPRRHDVTVDTSRPQSPDLDDFVIVPGFLPCCGSDDDVLMAMPSNRFTDVDSVTSGTCGSCSSLDRASMSPSPTIKKCFSSPPISVPRNGNGMKPPSSRPLSIPCELYATKFNQHSPTARPKSKGEISPASRTVSMSSMESMSPPTVQFLMGTPPSDYCSRWGSVTNMACSPRSATPSAFDMLSVPSDTPLAAVHPTIQGPVSLVPPELAERTLMTREHNDVMLKLEFTRDLSNSLIQLARRRSSPLTESIVDDVVNTAVTSLSAGSTVFVTERQRNVEQLLLYMRALELLASALNFARSALAAGQMHPSPATRQVLQEMNSDYQHCLSTCKYLSKGRSIADLSFSTLMTTDKLIYSCAIEMCQSAVMDELLGEMNECCHEYQMAYLLLHSLAQQASNMDDKKLLNKYKENVEKRLMTLFNQGFINAKFMTS